ncbi:hypothetical protein ACFL2V_19720 [Pseudomonadota bacterium]
MRKSLVIIVASLMIGLTGCNSQINNFNYQGYLGDEYVSFRRELKRKAPDFFILSVSKEDGSLVNYVDELESDWIPRNYRLSLDYKEVIENGERVTFESEQDLVIATREARQYLVQILITKTTNVIKELTSED